jgi:hypothetical protein
MVRGMQATLTWWCEAQAIAQAAPAAKRDPIASKRKQLPSKVHAYRESATIAG